MAQKVKWTEIAWSDLANVADYINMDSPYYATVFVNEVREASRSLKTFAEIGRIVPEFSNANIRELFIKKYRLIYKITNDAIYIIGFIHGARDLSGLWNKEDRSENG